MRYLKAYIGCATAVVGSLIVGASDGHITLLEYLIAAGAGLAALGGVAVAPNKTTAPTRKVKPHD